MISSAPKLDFNEPLERVPVGEMVARRILDMVKAGSLKPGDQLPTERDLAQSLNVSRPSVREAIRGLAILGVVRTVQGGGAYISNLDAEALLGPIQFFLSLQDLNITELYDARSLIESDVARRAAENMDGASLTRLEAILEAQKDCLDDPDAFRASDYAFHEIIWRGSGNAFLKRIGESLNVIGLEFRKRASESPAVLRQSYADHKVLVAALKARDADAAAKAAERHMQNVYRVTIEQPGLK
ncbi:MAG: FCD domain-containing protein [Phyllobacteriaceae bacterium]|jgi:DNA-binding FadR family transcriptional regulator|nr:FCD domain-containing protein [Phyllobacteriaceae bacterium]